jgi:UDP-N-acetylglucosamine---dolichyl-phosphate N-acetylglucosaminyltransferase
MKLLRLETSGREERRSRGDKRIIIVIPAYNEERSIIAVIRGLKQQGFARLIVVDDGSSDRTSELARQEGVILLRHILNRGLGGALGTGISAALRLGAELIVTFDADGQHDPNDIGRLLEPIENGEADVVIGSRLLDPIGMPYPRRLANWTANVVTYLLFRIWTTDSQSGLRAFSRQAAARMQLLTSGMEVSSEIIAETVKNRLQWKEVPVQAIYTDYSLSKGQSFTVGMRTLMRLILAKMRRLTL